MAIPAYGNQVASVPCEVSHIQTILTFREAGYKYHFGSASIPDIVESRNAFASIFYFGMPALSHMLFLDADMSFTPELIMDMLAFDKPVVGCFYPTKSIDPQFVGVPYEDMGYDPRGFIKASRLGTGILLIRRDCLQLMHERLGMLEPGPIDERLIGRTLKQYNVDKLIRPFDNIPWPQSKTGRLSEDYSFSFRWHDMCGGEMWANVNHPVSHWGLHEFRGRYLDWFKVEKVENDKSS